MTGRRTKEDIEKIVGELGYKFLNDYQDSVHHQKHVVIKDNKGYKYDISFNGMGKHIPFMVAAGNPFSLKNISLWLKYNNKSFKLTDNNKYILAGANLEFYCFKCKEIFYVNWNKIYSSNRGCPFCAGHQVGKYNNLAFLNPALAKEWHPTKNKNVSSTDVVLFSNKDVWWLCSVCGYEWRASVSNRSQGRGCKSCYGKVVTDKNRFSILYPELVKEWNFIKNKNLSPNDVSWGSSKKVWWCCLQCGHEWEAHVSHRSRGSGCPKCKESRGEKRISRFLDNDNIDYTPQHKFFGCKNILPLPFDFYLLKHNIAIEYHGIQHYEQTRNNFFGDRTKLEETQKHDKIKADYCQNNNIPLLVIPYWDFKNIETILQNYLFKENNV